jgi:hypothetical protein
MTDTTAVERKLPVNVGVPLNGLDEAYRLSQNLSLATVMPDSLRGKPSDVLAIMLYGQELGLAPMQSVQSIYVVRGKPQLSADLWTALARRAGHKVRWGHCDDKAASVTIVREDDPDYPLTVKFTVEDAVQAGLCELRDGKVIARSQGGKPTPWETYTARMLRNRAISFCGKSQCPEVALGFAIEGDYDYIPAEPVEPSPPEMHGDTVDAEVIDPPDDPAQVAAALDQIQAEFVQPTLAGDDDNHE